MTEPTKDPKTTPQEPADADSSGSSQTSQATAAATAAVSQVRERLVAGEQFMLSAALTIVVVSFFIFEFLLDYRIVGDFTVLLSVLTILVIWVHRWGHYDFGKGYRILLAALGVSLALLALMSLLAWARIVLVSGGADIVRIIGLLTYWAAGVAAFMGGWQVFKTREE